MEEATPALAAIRDRLLNTPIAECEMTFHRMWGALQGKLDAAPATVLGAHGGITYSNDTPPAGNPNLADVPVTPGHWWYGFDCGHCDDLIPARVDPAFGDGEWYRIHQEIAAEIPEHADLQGSEVYRDLAYVRDECGGLAGQLAALAAASAPPTGEPLPRHPGEAGGV